MHGARLQLAALAVVALLASGCVALASPAEPTPATPPSEPRVVLLDGLGASAMEPSLAVRRAPGGPVVVAANINKIPGEALGNSIPMAIEVHRSLDGGATWASAALPPAVFEPFDPADRFDNSGDPVLAYARDGTLWLAGVATSGTSDPLLPQAETLMELSIFVTRSEDDGATWSPALLWARGLGPIAGVSHDKVWLAVDPDGTVHVTWTEFNGLVLTKLHYTRSFDQGVTWEEPRELALPDLTTFSQITGTTIAAPGAGRVYVSYSDLRGDGQPGRQLVLSSADGGDTFGPAAEVGSATFPRFGTVFADASAPERAYVVVPSAADVPLLQVSETQDGGATWSAPTLVDASRGGAQQHAAGFVLRDGRVVLGHYDAGWPEGERFTVTVLSPEGDVEGTPVGPATAPGIYRREYLGFAGLGNEAWGAWVAGDEATGTQLGVGAVRL